MSLWIWSLKETSKQSRKQVSRPWVSSIPSTKVVGAALQLYSCDYAWQSSIIFDQLRMTTVEI